MSISRFLGTMISFCYEGYFSGLYKFLKRFYLDFVPSWIQPSWDSRDISRMYWKGLSPTGHFPTRQEVLEHFSAPLGDYRSDYSMLLESA